MSSQHQTILLVDDDPDVLETLRLVLEGAGYTVATAPTAEQGLRRYDEAKPDAVIVDLMMEEIDAGVGFVKELRLRGNKAPVFMLTSVGDAMSVTTDTTALGLEAVLQKPVDRTSLLRMLRSRLGGGATG